MRKPKKYNVEWARTACADLSAIIDHIARDNTSAALSVLDKLEKTAQSLTVLPMRGRVVPELAAFGSRAYREIIVSPWRILYRISGKTVNVLAVVDGRRNVEDILLERFVR
jgi:plasmid stabilization system protein ParE